MGWIPEDQRTSVWYLLEPKFVVRVDQMALRTVDDIKLFGTPTSTNEYLDKELAKNKTTCMLSIAAMEDIHNRGYDIGVVNYEDTKKIYEHISNHLIAFKDLFTTSENISPDAEFLDELIRLDRFANVVYDKAKFILGEDVQHSLLARRLKGGGFSRSARAAATAKMLRRTGATSVPEASTAPMRDYGTNVAHAMPVMPTPPSEDSAEGSNYPERISLENMFERHKRIGDTRWK